MATKRCNEESLVTFDELFLVRSKLNRERIRLWLPPYTVDGEEGDIPMDLIARFSSELSLADHTIMFAFEKLRRHAVTKLRAKEVYESSGLATLNIHISWMSETNEKEKMDLSITARLDENVATICNRISDALQPHNFLFNNVRLIHKGTILKNEDVLFAQSVPNNANIMLMLTLKSVAQEDDVQTQMSDRVHETRKVAEALAKRVDAGTGRHDHYFLEIRNQQGKKIDLPEDERQSLSVALTLHEKGRVIMKEKNFIESLLLFLEADENFSNCRSEILNAVDNYALLCLDIVWCYFTLQKLDQLPDAEERLKKCKECFTKSYGPNMERLHLVKGNNINELVLFVRVHILEAICFYLRSNATKATQSLNKAEEHLKSLQIDDDKFTQLICMGFSPSEARLSLRACRGDVTTAIDFIAKRREEEKQRQEQYKKEREEHKSVKKYGRTSAGNVVDAEKLHNLEEMGFTTKKSAEALRQSNNDLNGALEYLSLNFNPDPLQEALQEGIEESISSDPNLPGPSSEEPSASKLANDRKEEEEDEFDLKVNETLKDISDQDQDDYLDLDLNEEAELVNKYRLLIASLSLS